MEALEAFFRPLLDLLEPPWNYVVGGVTLLIFIAPPLFKLLHEFIDLRAGRRRIEFEKTRLEILKLRAELEQMGHAARLREMPSELEPATVRPAQVSPTSVRPPAELEGVIRGWLQTHRRLSIVSLWTAQIFLAYIVGVFAIVTAISPFLLWTEPEVGRGGAIGAFFIYALLTIVAYVAFASVRSFRKRVTAR